VLDIGAVFVFAGGLGVCGAGPQSKAIPQAKQSSKEQALRFIIVVRPSWKPDSSLHQDQRKEISFIDRD